jgi:DNA-directed RNA polymerase specialized sigma24 family protein
MPEPTSNATNRLSPTEPMPQEAQDFARKVHTMLDGQSKDDATVERNLAGFDGMFDLIAAGLYSLASMLAGEGEDSIRLVETAVANAEVSACSQPEEARLASRRALVAAALELLAVRNASSLAAPVGLQHVDTCIEDDDLDAAGMSRDELERMMAGPDRDRVRTWLESLPCAMRTIFVLRAVGGYSTADTAALLARHGGPQAASWTGEAVRELFRQGLCSLASQMIKAGSSQ